MWLCMMTNVIRSFSLRRLYAIDATYSVSCELSQSMGEAEIASTAKIEKKICLTGRMDT